MKKITLYIVLLVGIALIGCKPTEKNYRAAYDAAQAKRTAEAEDPDMALMLGGHSLDRSEGGVAVKDSTGRSYPFKATPLFFEDTIEGNGEWYLAVSSYSMPTNARAQAYDMAQKGDSVTVARDGDNQWYVIGGRLSSKREAGESARRFIDTHPGFSFIGLEGHPLLILSPNR